MEMNGAASNPSQVQLTPQELCVVLAFERISVSANVEAEGLKKLGQSEAARQLLLVTEDMQKQIREYLEAKSRRIVVAPANAVPNILQS